MYDPMYGWREAGVLQKMFHGTCSQIHIHKLEFILFTSVKFILQKSLHIFVYFNIFLYLCSGFQFSRNYERERAYRFVDEIDEFVSTSVCCRDSCAAWNNQ